MGPLERQAAQRVLASGMLVQGPEVAGFERSLAALTGRAHAVAVSSGSSALLLSLQALGIGEGDEVLVPALSWPSPAHAVIGCGATPTLVEVDLAEWNAGAAAMAAARTDRTRAAIIIDQFGNPARVAEIAAALPGLQLLLDSACSLGSKRQGRECAADGLIACLSFHPRKVITTGEGGACLTDDPQLAEALRQLRNHGQASAGGFARAGGNHRMTELAAAIGAAQLTQLSQIVDTRRGLADRYTEQLCGVQPQACPPDSQPNHQTYGVLLPERFDAATRDGVVAGLRSGGIEAGPLSYALHRLPQLKQAAQRASERGHELTNAATIADRAMALPLHPGLEQQDQDRVIAAVNHAVDQEPGATP